jgi:trehalose 6-phosphate phosphatase
VSATNPLAPLVVDPRRAGVVSDFDGTLAPIVDDPTRARALPAAVDALRDLVDVVALVAIVSGRPIDFLRSQIPVDGVTLVGQYGLERVVDGAPRVDPRAATFVDAVAAAATEAEARFPRLVTERKGQVAFTLHWRTTPDAAPAPDALRDLARAYGLSLTPGRMAAELRVPVPVDKGVALQGLLDGSTLRACLFAGDDHGDRPAFAALADQQRRDPGFVGLAVAVRSAESPPPLLDAADLVVEGPAGLAALLADLAGTLTPPR